MPVYFADGTQHDHALLERNRTYIQTLSKADPITWLVVDLSCHSRGF